MKYNDTVFESSLMEIFDLTKNLNNDDFQHKLLDSLTIKKRTKKSKRKENVNFKDHPNLLTSDSDISEKNGFQENNFVLHNRHEEFCDFNLENDFFISTSRHKDILSEPSCFDIRDFINSPKIDYILKHNTHSCNAINLKLQEKDSIESKVEVKKKQCLKKPSAAQQRLNEEKIIRLLQKTFTCLDDISLSLSSKITMPDGEDEWQRRRVRTIEFSSRFQRNYLYQLGRQIIELQQVIKCPGRFKTASQCVLSAHQILLQTFLAYNNHIPTCLGNVVVEKLQLAIDHANTLFKVHLGLLVSTDPGAEMKKALIESIAGKFEIVLCKATDVMAPPVVHTQSKTPSIKTYLSTNKLKKNCFRKWIGSKFSMYTIPPNLKKGDVWRKSIVANKIKHADAIKSRYKTAGFKHRPPIAINKTETVLDKNKLESKKSSPCLSATPKNEDNIETMVERIKDQEDEDRCNNNDESRILENSEIVSPHLSKSLCETITQSNANEAVNQAQLDVMVRSLLDMTLAGTIDNENKTLHLGYDEHENGINDSFKNLLIERLPDLLKNNRNGKIELENGKRHFENDHECVDNNESNKNWQTYYVTGQKNAQLICIRDNSATPDLVLNQPNPSLASITRESSLEEITFENEDGKKLRTVKISRLSKPTLNVLKTLPIHTSILQDKIRRVKYTNENRKYCRKSKTYSWNIVEQTAERLFNDALLSIVKEIQLNSILESLYDSEFQ